MDIYSTERGAITNDSFYQQRPDINNDGEIVWDQDKEIWSNIRGKIGDGTHPSINDLGEIVWSFNGNIFSSVSGQLTFDDDPIAVMYDMYPQINNAGEIAFLRNDSIAFIPEPAISKILKLLMSYVP